MRSKEEVMNLILNYAKNDGRVRAVGMCGSRVNPKAPRDHFQDYDIVFIVSEMESFLSDPTWIDYFGERFLTQMPEQTTLFSPSLGGKFSYLMLFQGYTRIDLTLCPLSLKEDWNRGDEGISTILLDKDDLFRAPQLLSDKQYHLQMPTEANFLDCCNEFWWVCTYVVKGLCRNEFLYAVDHLTIQARTELLRMMSWRIGTERAFTFSLGKNNKYLPNYLEKHEFLELQSTYDVSTNKKVWHALQASQVMFIRESTKVAKSQLMTLRPRKSLKAVTNFVYSYLRYLLFVNQLFWSCIFSPIL